MKLNVAAPKGTLMKSQCRSILSSKKPAYCLESWLWSPRTPYMHNSSSNTQEGFPIVIRRVTDETLWPHFILILPEVPVSIKAGFFFKLALAPICVNLHIIFVFIYPLNVWFSSLSLSSSCPVVGCGNSDVKESDLIPDQVLRRKIQSQKRNSNRT